MTNTTNSFQERINLRRVVVTGTSLISPIGNDPDTAFYNALNCKSGLNYINSFDTTHNLIKIGGEIPHPELPEDIKFFKKNDYIPPYITYTLTTIYNLLKNSDLDSKNMHKLGLVMGLSELSQDSGINLIQQFNDKKEVKNNVYINSLPATLFRLLSDIFMFGGSSSIITTACSSSNHSIIEAFLSIRSGISDILIAGGTEESLSSIGLKSFEVLGALSKISEPKKASRPFDIDRNGFVLSNGAGYIILEDLEHAIKRRANILCEIVGIGCTTDYNSLTAPPKDGIGAYRAMENCLRMAGITEDKVDYINAHGTATRYNDISEAYAIKQLFKDNVKNLSISSTKGVTGHCLSAASVIESILTIKSIQNSIVLPTANLDNPDPNCLNLDFTPLKGKEKKISYALSNSFGFGGVNSSILFKKFE